MRFLSQDENNIIMPTETDPTPDQAKRDSYRQSAPKCLEYAKIQAQVAQNADSSAQEKEFALRELDSIRGQTEEIAWFARELQKEHAAEPEQDLYAETAQITEQIKNEIDELYLEVMDSKQIETEFLEFALDDETIPEANVAPVSILEENDENEMEFDEHLSAAIHARDALKNMTLMLEEKHRVLRTDLTTDFAFNPERARIIALNTPSEVPEKNEILVLPGMGHIVLKFFWNNKLIRIELPHDSLLTHQVQLFQNPNDNSQPILSLAIQQVTEISNHFKSLTELKIQSENNIQEFRTQMNLYIEQYHPETTERFYTKSENKILILKIQQLFIELKSEIPDQDYEVKNILNRITNTLERLCERVEHRDEIDPDLYLDVRIEIDAIIARLIRFDQKIPPMLPQVLTEYRRAQNNTTELKKIFSEIQSWIEEQKQALAFQDSVVFLFNPTPPDPNEPQ